MKKKIFIITLFTALVVAVLWLCPGPTSGKFYLRRITTSGISYYSFRDGTIYAVEAGAGKTYELGSYIDGPDGIAVKINGAVADKSFRLKFYLMRVSAYNSKTKSYDTMGYRIW